MQTLGATDPTPRPRRVVILAGEKSHGPEGNGLHDYPAQARLLQDALQRSDLAPQLSVTRAEGGAWPADAVAQADALVVISDGRDGDLPFPEALHLRGPQRVAEVEAAVSRGTGVVAVHFATFASEKDLPRALAWQGAAFQWEQGGERRWASRLTWATGVLDLLRRDHPVLRGVSTDRLHEEFYHELAFHPDATPLVGVRALPGAGERSQAVAWAIERPDGGRGFGTTMGHSLDTLRHDGVRTLLLNGIAWTAGASVPAEGLRVSYAEREEVDDRLGVRPHPGPIRVAILAGNNAHRWHNWPETTGALLRLLGDDPRVTARVHTDPDDLPASLEDRHVLVLNWCNWHDPAGLSPAARQAIERFTHRGGGVFVHHFANGACHASLPQTGGASDWPWYRTLVRRVWEHRDLAPGRSSHDDYGRFQVRPRGDHPLVAGLPPFEVEDELYWRQHGDQPIEPLLVATSSQTGAQEPLAWAYEVNQSRVVQSLLGHSAATYREGPSRAFVRRAVAWCARRAIHQ